jgi:hypothetical protein
MMEQRGFIKITLEDGLDAFERHRQLIEGYGREALSYSAATYSHHEFRTGRQEAENNPRPGRPPDFGIRFRGERTLAAFPNGSVRRIAEITGYEPSMIFYILTQVFYLNFRPWGRVSNSVVDAQKVGRIAGEELPQAELLAAKRRNWKSFWTGDKSWILWNTQRSGSRLAVDQELPVRVKQTIRPPTAEGALYAIAQQLSRDGWICATVYCE